MKQFLIKNIFIKYNFFKKINEYNNKKIRIIVITRSRSSFIIPKMIGHIIAIHNGEYYYPIYITKYMVGYKLGEFVSTISYKKNIK
uniref:ribosomal protein S19 n=1 Tax=Pogoniopsis schenckii TaxID=1582014 RepID=UPI002236F073|nr:ribosomal protein S19 [Pogoniopsis schenckii]UYP51009.1 ribosomal protein S19 [Pogoniopsis schenckii]